MMTNKSKRAWKAQSKKGNNRKPKASNTHARVPAGPPNPSVNKNQESDMHIERSLAANPTADLPLQQNSPAMYPTSTHEIDTSRPSSTMKASFLLLPPEIRWQIYQELFQPHRVEILRRKGNRRKGKNLGPRKPTPYRLCYRPLPLRDGHSQTLIRVPRWVWMPALTSFPTALAVVFTCRLTYCETIHLFYSKMQFVFRCTKTAARFLKTTSRDVQSAIRHVELVNIMYNEPRLTEFRPYKFRSDRAWYFVCDEMSQNFESLRVLHVDLAVHDWPIDLELGERWSFPLLVFGEKNLLDDARIVLRMPRFSREKLRFVSRSVEEKIMNPESFQIREDERLARQLMGPVKARKVLKIGF